ncbi:MAG: Indole-3-glycerol phosphate synthase [Anaerolineales bacterium]|nr:Indole-3-glycerol phosphate synthase [Anaerolineales bacterium]
MLDQILAHKRTEIERLDLAALKSMAADSPAPRDFLAALGPHPNPLPFAQPPTALRSAQDANRGGEADSPPLSGKFPTGEGSGVGAVRLIAELKRASPSRGLLAPHLDMLQLAQIYAANGAAALSVLTDEKYFLGSLATLRSLRRSAALLPPLLRKDFILCPAQLYESRAAGADAILLIAAALPADAELADLHALALDLGLTPLVEIHTLDELERVLRLPALKLVGINNRDLKTFTVSLDTTVQLRPHIPRSGAPGIRVVSESGIFTAAQVALLAALGVDAILVGEALVTAPDIGAKVRELSGKEGTEGKRGIRKPAVPAVP